MKLIIASDPTGGIGCEGKLPWDKLEGDLKRFKKLTDGQVILMGRKTFESLPVKPLSNRLNIVLSSKSFSVPKLTFIINDVKQILDYKNIWLIGGASAIKECWNYIDTIHLSETLLKYKSDTFIDLEKIKNEFNLVHAEGNVDHVYQIWNRKSNK